MKLFESSWTIKGRNYLREFDTETNKSELRHTNHKSEYFTKDVLGTYKSILDESITLKRESGSSYNVTDAFGVTNSDFVSIREEHFGKDTYNKNPNVWYLDIETSVGTHPDSEGFPNPEDALEPIVLIQLWDTSQKKGYVLGLEEWYHQKDYKYDFELEYIHCESEHALIRKYLDLFAELNPLIIYAYNGNGFDYPYIYNRLKNLKIGVENLSNYGNVKLVTKPGANGMIIHKLNAIGHTYFDMMDVYKKFVFETVASYSLDYIGEKETGIGKVNHDNYIKFDDFRIGKYKILGNETKEQQSKLIHKCAVALENGLTDDVQQAKYKKYIKEKSYSEFVHYGVIDFVLLKGIDDSRNFTSLIVSMAEMMGCQHEDTLGTLKAWASYISNKALEDNLVMPPKEDHPDTSIVGGYVAKPNAGKHEWILSSDINSAYPLLGIVGHNMSAETFVPVERRPKELQDRVDKYYFDQDQFRVLDLPQEVHDETTRMLEKYNMSLGLNGAVFTRDYEGILPRLVNGIYADRKKAKKAMFVHDQNIVDIKEEMSKRGLSLE